MSAADDVPDQTTVLQDVRASTACLLSDLTAAGWGDEDVRAETALPGWSRGHVLTHVARNADALAGCLSGGLVGEPVPMYPSVEARGADIEAGAGRPVLELLADVRDSADRLDRVLAAVADEEAWDADCGDGRDAAVLLLMRWCEVEIHKVDVGLGAVADWPPAFVSRVLPVAADPSALSRRVDRPVRLDVAGGVVTELDGTQWGAAPDDGSSGDADRDPTVVEAEDWALLGWLTGRHHLDTDVEPAPWKLV